jgi:GLPGLI family protein
MKLITSFLLLGLTISIKAQVVEAHYECKSLFSQNVLAKADKLPMSKKLELMENFSGLTKHYSVRSDGMQNVRQMDSLTQKCNVEKVTVYTYQQILVRNNNNWDNYCKLNDQPGAVAYKINSRSSYQNWKVDYQSTKNILGFTCYYAQNVSNKNEWAWFTLDIPVSVTPVSKFPLHGLVLEFRDESDIYTCQQVKMDDSIKNFECFDESNQVIQELEQFKDFADILIGTGEKLSTDMFACRP